MEEFLFPYHTYVPLSVFGEYFLVEEELEIKARRKPAVLLSSPLSPRVVERPPSYEEKGNDLRIRVDFIGYHSLERGQDFHTVSRYCCF